MKRKILLLVLFLTGIYHVQAQIRGGVNFALGSSWFRYSGKGEEKGSAGKFAYGVGIKGEYFVSESFGFGFGLNFASFGANGADYKMKITR
ncbi:MAG: hypothetical protein NZ108_04440, partial [Bacteroidia bacterium]|nr:hypothetical protein [Bacteroidia bacterium]